MGGEKWQAGITYLKVLLHALSQHHRKDVTVCLLASGNMSNGLEELNQIADEVLPMSAFRKRTVLRGINLVMKRALQRDWLGGSFLKQHKIDVVFGLCMQYRYNTIPTLSFVFDFQHVHMPEMFSLRERLMRDLAFCQTARLSTRIVVMSQAVKRDFEALFPKYAYKVRVLKTGSYIPQSVYEIYPESVSRLYQLYQSNHQKRESAAMNGQQTGNFEMKRQRRSGGAEAEEFNHGMEWNSKNSRELVDRTYA